MKKLIFTVYMLLLFIFAATAHPNHVTSKTDTHVVVVKTVSKKAAIVKKERAIRHKRLHRREARVERRVHRAHRRHSRVHH